MPAVLLSIWNNTTARYIILALILIAVIYFYGRKAGKDAAEEESKTIPLPNNGTDIPTGWRPDKLANEIYTKLNGVWTSAANKETTIVAIMNLTDGQLVAVYNAFQSLFGSLGKGSLTKWLRDEFNVTVGGARDSLVDRLVQLKCL